MTCPGCSFSFLVLYACADGVHRCESCRQKAGRGPAPRPYVEASRRRKETVRSFYPTRRGRLQVLGQIEDELAHEMAGLRKAEGHANPQYLDGMIAGLKLAIQTVRDHRVLDRDGNPVREARP